MATCTVYRLEPRAPFHFGERGVGIEETAETFRSDSLFSALCVVLREGWGRAALEELLGAFLEGGEPPFLLSSCFPYAGEVLFFPRPMLAPPLAEQYPDTAKRLKSVRFVSSEIFRRWLDGTSVDAEARAANFIGASRAWLSAAERARLAGLLPAGAGEDGTPALWWKGDVPRVTVDRRTAASAVYRCGRLVFQAGCGLYFLVQWRDAAFRPRLEQALRALGDAGLGGRRSIGHGQFEPRAAEPIELPSAPAPDALLTLALYWPTPAELAAGVLDGPARYDLLSRYGWIASPEGRSWRRREVRMVAEGSVLAGVGTARGALARVTPRGFQAHEVYRYGLAFPLPIHLGERARG